MTPTRMAVAGGGVTGDRVTGRSVGDDGNGTDDAAVATPDAGRWELLRTLGAVTATVPPGTDHLFEALGVPPLTRADHTRLFALELPPHASIHLGPEGKLGGEGADRVAGMWRTLGLDPPADADHLSALTALYAELGESAGSSRSERTRLRLEHARATVLWEHLWPWVPGYLDAVRRHHRAARAWADLVGVALVREAGRTAAARALPAALRDAPAGLDPDGSVTDLLDALTAPVRTGFVLDASDVADAATATGAGLRRGERRFALRSLLEQDPRGTLTWLAGHAATWVDLHRSHHPVAFDPAPWWAARAAHSALVLTRLAHRAG